jgi:hypothetical protein
LDLFESESRDLFARVVDAICVKAFGFIQLRRAAIGAASENENKNKCKKCGWKSPFDDKAFHQAVMSLRGATVTGALRPLGQKTSD